MPNRHPVQNNMVMLVTSVTFDREPMFLDDPIAREAIETLLRVKHLHPFFLYAFVVMPDHIHLLVNIPAPYTISRMMSTFKSGVAFNVGMHRMWQRGFHIQRIRNPYPSIEYIHMNPVVAGIVRSAAEYPWSSAHGQWSVDSLSSRVVAAAVPGRGPLQEPPRSRKKQCTKTAQTRNISGP